MLRSHPHGEDHGAVAGGDTSALQKPMGRAVAMGSAGTPPGEDGLATAGLENAAHEYALNSIDGGGGGAPNPDDIDFLGLVRNAEDNALLYVAQINRKLWSQTNRAFHGEHYIGSKYTRPEWRGRSKLFVPKTRTAVRKDNAAVAASLFNSIDAISCTAGDDGDMQQRGAAALMQELVNYRCGGRPAGPGSMPWFLIAMGARQDAVLSGICVTKQSWLQKHKRSHTEHVLMDGGVKERDVYKLTVDRPDIRLFPPENIVIDSAADWTNPAQSAAFILLKYPMTLDEIKEKQDSPINPWNGIDEPTLRSAAEAGKFDMAAIRRARELGQDRFDEAQAGSAFQPIWVYETFIRIRGEDWTFFSIGSKDYLTDPKPVSEVYPEQHGERPVAFGYGSLESHRIFPMSPAASWQPLQVEANDIRNLQLDGVKQNIMPITKIRRGRQVDLSQVQRRSAGSAILVNEPDDVTFEKPPEGSQSAIEMNREIDLELDDLSGQQNYGTVENNNAVGKTLGGLKLAAGSANAVAEFDVRLWIETWANPALQQVVRLEQYYEQDKVVLGVCGQKAQLWQKHGINQITDDLMSQDITVRISVGLGAGDPMQRLAKFQIASQTIAPILAQSPAFQSGQKEINVDAIIEEVFGAVGYKDALSRFFKDNGQPRANPMQDLQTRKLMAEIAQRDRQGKGSLLQGLAAIAKAALGKRELEADVVDMLLSHQGDAQDRGFEHGHRRNELHLSAMDHGTRHALAITDQRHGHRMDIHNAARDAAADAAEQVGGDAEMEAGAQSSPTQGPASGAAPQAPPSASPPQDPRAAIMQMLASGQVRFTRGADGRINGATMPGRSPYPVPQLGR